MAQKRSYGRAISPASRRPTGRAASGEPGTGAPSVIEPTIAFDRPDFVDGTRRVEFFVCADCEGRFTGAVNDGSPSYEGGVRLAAVVDPDLPDGFRQVVVPCRCPLGRIIASTWGPFRPVPEGHPPTRAVADWFNDLGRRTDWRGADCKDQTWDLRQWRSAWEDLRGVRAITPGELEGWRTWARNKMRETIERFEPVVENEAIGLELVEGDLL